jgi:hypothetical protein
MGSAREMRDPPAAHDAREAIVRVVIQHDNLRTREMQLLHRAQPDVVEPADDHMADPVSALL